MKPGLFNEGPGQGGGLPLPKGAIGDPLQDAFRAQLLRLMAQGEAPVDEESLGIRQPYQAASLAAQRAQDRERNVLAEQNYASGQGQGGLSQALQQSAERNAVGLAGIKSGLIGNEVAARRQQLNQALQLANSIGARTEAQQLQRELAQLDQQFRYSQLGQQESQFGRSLGQQQGQFEDTFGLQRQQWIDQQNRAAYLASLGQ